MPYSSSRSIILEPQFNKIPGNCPCRHNRPHTATSTIHLSVSGKARRPTADRSPRADPDVFLNHHSKEIILKLAGWGNRHAGRPPVGDGAVEQGITDGLEGECLWCPWTVNCYFRR